MKTTHVSRTLAVIILLLVVLGAGCDLVPQATPLPISTTSPMSMPTLTAALTHTSTATPQPTLTPKPTRTSTPTPVPLPTPTGDPVVLFFRDDRLWLTDVQSSGIESCPAVELPERPERSLIDAILFHHHLFGFSPDRRWLYVGSGPGHGALLFDLHTYTASAVEPLGPPRVSWAPDSQRFAFVRARLLSSTNELVYEGRLCLYDTTTLSWSEMAIPVPQPWDLAWSPTGRHVTICEGVWGGEEEVWLIDVVDQTAKQIGSCSGGSYEGGWLVDETRQVLSVCWSVDGQRLAMRQSDNRWLVYALGDGSTRLVEPAALATAAWNVELLQGYLAYAALSPDSRHVARASRPTSLWEENWWTKPSEVRIDDQQTGQTMHRWSIPGPVTIVRWSPDGQYLVLNILDTEKVVNMEEGPVRSAIWRLRADGTGKLESIVDDAFLLEVLPPRQ